ncbi:MAG: hypothetical protein O7F69_12815 [Alphaproteobacteria bacterium]|nr:hypothetical protein [Alphaproteobacteria bacterium]
MMTSDVRFPLKSGRLKRCGFMSGGDPQRTLDALRRYANLHVFCYDLMSNQSKGDTMAVATLPIAGGCLCGAMRYEADEPPFTGTYCHCRMCRRITGSAFIFDAAPNRHVWKE